MDKSFFSKVTAVEVYTDTAKVTRVGAAKFDEGEHIVSIAELPLGLQPDSIRVKGTGKGRILEVRTVKRSELEKPDDEEKAVAVRVMELEREIAELDASSDGLSRRRGMLEKIASSADVQFARRYFTGETGIDKLSDLDRFMGEQFEALSKQIQQVDERTAVARAELTALLNNLERIRTGREVRKFSQVDVSLLSEEYGEFSLSVEYHTKGAWWRPTYDLEVSGEKLAVRLTAELKNDTGEDWRETEMRVTTASSRPVSIVEPNPWYLDVYEPYLAKSGAGVRSAPRVMKKGRVKGEDEIAELEVDYMPPPASEPMPMLEQVAAEVSFSGEIVVYTIPGKVTVKSGEEPHGFFIEEFEVEAKRDYYWNAARDARVAERFKMAGLDRLLLPGRGRVYADGEFVGSTSLKLMRAGEEANIGTRESFALKVEKKLQEREADRGILSRGKVDTSYDYNLEIENLTEKTIPVEVVDTVPYSRSEKIDVKYDLDPEPEENKLGVVKWKVEIGSKEKVTLSEEFTVTYPEDVSVTPPLP